MDAKAVFRGIAFTCSMLIGVAGCSGGGGGEDNDDAVVAPPVVDTETPPQNSNAFGAVDAEARATFESLGINGMGLTVYDAQGNKVFESMYGNYSADQRVFVASASKLISGLVFFRLVDAGILSLDSTTAELLGWSGEEGTITLRHLLSQKSGLKEDNVCTLVPQLTLQLCTEAIHDAGTRAAPGTRFDYGSTHFTVAGRMAEVATGKAWNTVFADEILNPLGMPADLQYYVLPDNTEPTDNPMLAGGLVMSMNEYATLLQLVFNKGSWQGSQFVSTQLFDQQATDPYPDAQINVIGSHTSIAHYGLAAWLECDTPATGCAVISSPGVYGFTPWIDRANGYYAIIGMEDHNVLHYGAAELLQKRLQPLIVGALQQR